MEEASPRELRVRLLGPFEVWHGQELIPQSAWPQHKTQRLLQLLLSERGQVFSCERLCDLLFPDLNPQKARESLYGRISELRRLLEPNLPSGRGSQYILHQNSGYCFSPEAPCRLDLEEFEKQIATAQEAQQAGRWPEALEHYQEAIALYREGFLAEEPYEEWALAPREHYRELFLDALSQLAECQARLGRLSQAIESCRQLLERAPTREEAYRQLMSYLALASERSQALQTYAACVEALREKLDVEPSPETRALYEKISTSKAVDPEGIYPKPAAPAQHNLPSSLTSFIGRRRELAEVKRRLSTTRLLTLSGVGGCGKTRLALQTAADLVKSFAQGVWWVDLSGLAKPALVLLAVAAAFGVREQPDTPLLDTLSSYLQALQALLVLDNCEHLLEASSQLATALLLACPNFKILATSREPLGIPGEAVWPVPPLALPDLTLLPFVEDLKQYDAIGLFVERAAARKPDWAMTEQNAPAVVQICQRLEGLPLAIELAAARVRTLPVEQLIARLDGALHLLRGGEGTTLPRHRTLQATMDWSFSLLTEAERILLRRLSVFAGGFTLEAAEGVCADVGANLRVRPTRSDTPLSPDEILDLLTRLVDKSLVGMKEAGAEVRYTLLEMVRQYGQAKLQTAGELDRLRDRHLDFFLRFAERAEPELSGASQGVWLDRLEIEHNNLRVALEWSLQSDVEAGLRLAGALLKFWTVRGHATEGRSYLKPVLAESGNRSSPLRAKVLNGAGLLALDQGDYAAARSLFEESLAASRELGEKPQIATALNGLGNIAARGGDYARARSHFEESLTIRRELGDQLGVSASLNNLGAVAYFQGDYAAARSFHEESLAIKRQLGDKWGMAFSLNSLGLIAFEQGDFATARRLYEQSLALSQELKNKPNIAIALSNLGNATLEQGDYAAARSFYEESLAVSRELGDRRSVAIALSNLGGLAERQGDYVTACSRYEESLTIRRELGSKLDIVYSLWGFATLAAAQGQPERAAWLLGAVEALRQAISAAPTLHHRTEYDRTAAAVRAKLGEEAFAAAWAQGRAMTLEQAIEYALKG